MIGAHEPDAPGDDAAATRRGAWRALAVAALVAGGASIASPSRQDLAPPTSMTTDCTTSGCHGDLVSRPFVHGPAAADCTACHAWVDPAAHRFELRRAGADLCVFCHVNALDLHGAVTHAPVAQGECLACHDPHGSAHPMFLPGTRTADVCLACHDSVGHEGAAVHAPVRDGDCLACHQAHASDHAALLVRSGPPLCLSCHADVLPAEPDDPAAPRAFVHGPAAADCLVCHAPHAGTHATLLLQPASDLCVHCHDDVGAIVAHARVPHAAASEGEGCISCHEPHVASHAALLSGAPIEVCGSCHERPIKGRGGRTVAAIERLDQAAAFGHGPVREGDCGACHAPHGGQHHALLPGAFPGTFYEAFAPEAYGACFTCHDPALAESATTTATRFRDGERNLHWVHVTEPGRKGRSCRVCHEVHVGHDATLVRAETTFGEWKIPIGFVPTETGGGCAAGCHRARAYDRVAPVGELREAAAPEASPAPAAIDASAP